MTLKSNASPQDLSYVFPIITGPKSRAGRFPLAEPTAETFVIDDDESVRASLGRLLYSAGYRSQSFASALEFLDFLQSDQVPCGLACAIIDIHMLGMDGIE